MANNSYRSNVNQPGWLTILRIALGIILIWKAYKFILNTASAKALIQQADIEAFSQNLEVLYFVITYLGLLCGFFILVGLFTRWASIIQIPVLIVAVFFVNIRNIGEDVFEFVLSLVTLVLLFLFAVKGSGPLSADEYFRRGAAVDAESKKLKKFYNEP